MKKYTFITLIFAMVLLMLTLFSGCAEKASEGLEFKSNGDGTCTVVGMGTCTDENLVIPKKSPDGDKVTAIGSNAFEDSKLRTVSMPDTVTEIGPSAFKFNHRLETVTFSKSLKKIGDKAFWGCDTITEITLPDSLEEFGKSVGSDGTEYEYSGVFQNCEKLSKINIPQNLKAIYEDTFKGTALTEVEIDADFKYGRFLPLFWDDEEKTTFRLPTVYRSNSGESSEILELTDDMKSLLYCEVFHSENLKINGEELVIPAMQCTPGMYGSETDRYAYEITESGEIHELYYDTTYGKYQRKEEFVYKFSYNEALKVYEIKVRDTLARFAVYGSYLIMQNGSRYALNVEYVEG